MLDLFKSKKHALGLYYDGQRLHVAGLVQQNKKVVLVDVQSFDLHPAEDDSGFNRNSADSDLLDEKEKTSHIDDLDQALDDDLDALLHGDAEGSDDDISTDLQKDILKEGVDSDTGGEYLPKSEGAFPASFVDKLQDILRYYPKNVHLGFTFQEPTLFNASFFSDWGIDGAKLKQKIITELSKENPEISNIDPKNLQVIKTAQSGILAVLNDSEAEFLAQVYNYEKSYGRRLPKIGFIDSADIALFNLISYNYSFRPEDITLLVYVGTEYSKLIFMLGNELLHVSQRIDEGIDSIIVFDTIYNRIILEQDKLNVPRINRVITVGETRESGIGFYLSRMFPKKSNIRVENFKLKNLYVKNSKKFKGSLVSQYAIPIGSAWRALGEKNNHVVDLNLLPEKIVEGQKLLKLGIVGWILLILLFAGTFYFTAKIITDENYYTEQQSVLQLKQTELDYLREIEAQLAEASKKLDEYKKTYSTLGNMLDKTLDWNGFLKKVSAITRSIGGTWITEMSPSGPDKVTLRGYSLYRDRISRFSDDIGGTVLKKVEVSEIRQRTVYYFELSAAVPPKKEKEIKLPENQ